MNIPSFPLTLKLYFGTLGILALASVAYSIATRTPQDYFFYTSILTGAWTLLLAKWSMDLAHAAGRTIPEPNFRHFVYFLVRAVPLAVASYGIIVGIKDLYLWATVVKYGVAVSATALVSGAFLFVLREHSRVLYGSIEVAVGLLVAGYRSDPGTPFWDLNAFLPFLTAGVYLVVRGFDNMAQGLRQSEPDPMVALVRTFGVARPVSVSRPQRRLKAREVRKSKLTILKERLQK